jgi:mono/diheme cytochrome c family protein
MADGEIFSVISQGRRSMPGYRFQILEADRWAIVSYVRALQRASRGTVEDVPEPLRASLR